MNEKNCLNCRYYNSGNVLCGTCLTDGECPPTNWRTREIDGNYQTLYEVLGEALDQAGSGKGKDRHADNQPFEEQPIMWIEKYFKSYQLGQAVKKIHESQRLDTDAAIKELLGAINYLAAKIIMLKTKTFPDTHTAPIMTKEDEEFYKHIAG